MAEVVVITAESTLEQLAAKAPLDGTLQIVVYNGISWPTERPGNNLFWLDTSGLAPIPELFDSTRDVLVQPGLA